MENLDPNHEFGISLTGAPLSTAATPLPTHSRNASSSSSLSSGVLVVSKQGGGAQRRGGRYRDESELSGIDWVDSVVDVATTCKKIFTAHTCRLCQVYTDAQVEYEVRQEETAQQQQEPLSQPQHQRAAKGSSFFQALPNSLEVELYRQFLFDEESVVEGVNEREKEFDEMHSTTTQRT
jgi:hypothetical protein